MLHTATPRVFRLGDLAPARGSLDPVNLKAHEDEVARGIRLMSLPSSYAPYINEHVICIDDRLSGAAGLAGGALSLGFMHNYLFGGRFLSHALHHLHSLFHKECGALDLVMNGFVQRRLTNVHAGGYKFLEAIGFKVPMMIRRNIAAWARTLPINFVDLDESMGVAKAILGVSGPHIGGLIGVSLNSGHGFTAHDELKRETGMLAFRFDPTVAFREVKRIAAGHAKADEAALLALVFTAEVILELMGPEAIVGIHK